MIRYGAQRARSNQGLGASGLRGPEPKCKSIYLSIYLSIYADTMTLIGTPDLQINARLLPTCLPVKMDAKHLVFMFVLL